MSQHHHHIPPTTPHAGIALLVFGVFFVSNRTSTARSPSVGWPSVMKRMCWSGVTARGRPMVVPLLLLLLLPLLLLLLLLLRTLPRLVRGDGDRVEAIHFPVVEAKSEHEKQYHSYLKT